MNMKGGGGRKKVQPALIFHSLHDYAEHWGGTMSYHHQDFCKQSHMLEFMLPKNHGLRGHLVILLTSKLL